MTLSPERALVEIDELLRTLPEADQFLHPSVYPDAAPWSGRFTAVMRAISFPMGASAGAAVIGLEATYSVDMARNRCISLLHEARYSIVLQMPAPTSIQIGAKAPFDYFDEVRKLVSTSVSDLLFVDPYLDPSFIGRYMPHVAGGVKVRLLGSKGVPALASSATMFTTQSGLAIEVRQTSSALHDRFVFVDGRSCYQSGASFKDGGTKAPATIAQIVDAFAAVQATYEGLWASGTAVP